jgi:hypothetical protein
MLSCHQEISVKHVGGALTFGVVWHLELAQVDVAAVLLAQSAALELQLGLPRDHDLAAVGDGGDACRGVNHRSNVLHAPGLRVADHARLAHMHAHPHPQPSIDRSAALMV